MPAIQSAVQVPVPPAPPQPPAIAGATPYSTSQLPGRSLTQPEVDALRARRTEISRQLTSTQGRRDEAARALNKASEGPARVGIEARLTVLDQRIVQLEQDLASTGKALTDGVPGDASEIADANARNNNWGGMSSGQITAVSIVSIIFVWGPLAWAAARMMLKRSSVAKPSPQILESTARLERMEQAVDSIAIEIERISEGQRFVTQIMSKRPEQAALNVGQAPAEPISVAQPEQVSFNRG